MNNQNINYNFEGKLLIKGKIRVLTGLHIGGIKETLDIGGIDNSFIRTKRGKAYIPGSSLRGKLRSLLEKKEKAFENNGEPSSKVNYITKIFGLHKSKGEEEKEVLPATLIVRDAYLDDNFLDVREVKMENVINRLTGKAKHPRETERIAEGSTFTFEVIFNLHYGNENQTLLEKLLEGFKLLEDDYLGGSGTRGYGKIKFENIEITRRSKEFYEGKAQEVKHTFRDIEDLMQNIDKVFV